MVSVRGRPNGIGFNTNIFGSNISFGVNNSPKTSIV